MAEHKRSALTPIGEKLYDDAMREYQESLLNLRERLSEKINVIYKDHSVKKEGDDD